MYLLDSISYFKRASVALNNNTAAEMEIKIIACSNKDVEVNQKFSFSFPCLTIAIKNVHCFL